MLGYPIHTLSYRRLVQSHGPFRRLSDVDDTSECWGTRSTHSHTAGLSDPTDLSGCDRKDVLQSVLSLVLNMWLWRFTALLLLLQLRVIATAMLV